MFNELDVDKDEYLSKVEIRLLFECYGIDWGFFFIGDVEMEELFDQVFKVVDIDNSGEVEKFEFEVFVKILFVEFLEMLWLNLILVEVEVVFC